MRKKQFYYTVDEFSDEQINKLVEHITILTCGYWEQIAYDKCYGAIYKLKDTKINKEDRISLHFTLDVGAELILSVLGALKLPVCSTEIKRLTIK